MIIIEVINSTAVLAKGRHGIFVQKPALLKNYYKKSMDITWGYVAMKKLLILCLLSAVGTAHAGLFQGTSTGTFENPTGPGVPLNVTGVGTNAFTWGDGTGFNSPPSSLGYTGTNFDNDENEAFTFGTLDYFNGTIADGTEADTVDLSVSLSFTAPTGFVENFLFNLDLINTTNTSDPNASADIVNFDNTVPSNFFTLDGIDYTLEFLGFGALTGDGFTVEDSFRVLEGSSASVDLLGRITSTPGVVPVPAAVWLFGTALIGLVGFGKRKSKSVV